jgi:hypothetical protein
MHIGGRPRASTSFAPMAKLLDHRQCAMLSPCPKNRDPMTQQSSRRRTARRAPMIGCSTKWKSGRATKRRLVAGSMRAKSCKSAGDLCTVHKAPTTDPANNPAADAGSAAYSRNRFPYAAPAALVCLRGATSNAGHRKMNTHQVGYKKTTCRERTATQPR